MGRREPCPQCNAGLHSYVTMDVCDFCGRTGWVTYGKTEPSPEPTKDTRPMGYKYIIVQKGNRELPFIFPDECVHALMFKCVRAMVKAEVRMMYPTASKKMLEDAADALKVVGAGSVRIDVGPATGSSETLGVQARAGDTAMMQAFPYTHGALPE